MRNSWSKNGRRSVFVDGNTCQQDGQPVCDANQGQLYKALDRDEYKQVAQSTDQDKHNQELSRINWSQRYNKAKLASELKAIVQLLWVLGLNTHIPEPGLNDLFPSL